MEHRKQELASKPVEETQFRYVVFSGHSGADIISRDKEDWIEGEGDNEILCTILEEEGLADDYDCAMTVADARDAARYILDELGGEQNQNAAPQHTLLPWYVTGAHVQSAAINEDNYICEAEGDSVLQAEANARLITASVNAIGAMAARLGCNPVELAERMATGEGVALIEVLNDAEALFYTLGDLNTQESRDCYTLYDSIRQTLARLKGV